MGDDLLEAFPPPPVTNKLIIKGEGDQAVLTLPLPIVKEWQFKPNFGSKFVAWMDTFTTNSAKHRIAQEDEPKNKVGSSLPDAYLDGFYVALGLGDRATPGLSSDNHA